MLKNSKCDICKLNKICKAKTKLNSFTDEARVDLGVTLTFDSCDNLVEVDANADEAEDEEE